MSRDVYTRDGEFCVCLLVMFHDSTQRSRWMFSDASEIDDLRKTTNREWSAKVVQTLEILTRQKLLLWILKYFNTLLVRELRKGSTMLFLHGKKKAYFVLII